jgi:hypothetical protein
MQRTHTCLSLFIVITICVTIFGQSMSVAPATQAPTGCMSLRPKSATDVDDSEDVEFLNTEKTLDARLQQEADFMNTGFQMPVVVHWYKSDNCKAVKGTGIFLGRSLIDTLLKKADSKEVGVRAAAWALAHEYTHMIQYEYYGDDVNKFTTRELELQADFHAGMWMGWRIAGSEFYSYTEAAKLSFKYGSPDWKNPDIHGTPVQRERAVISGIEAGRQSQGLAHPPTWDVATYGNVMNKRPLLDWMMVEVRKIIERGH